MSALTRSARRARRARLCGRTSLVSLAASLAVLGLVGCSEDRLGAAAVIEGRTISTEDLQASARAHLDAVPDGDSGNAALVILQRKIVSAVLDQVARDHDVRVREGRVAAERDDVLQSVGGRKELVRTLAQAQQPTVLAPSEVDRWVKDRLLFNAIARDICGCDLAPDAEETQQAFTAANDELREASAALDIEVSPRYGEWDAERGITPLVSGGLSKTVDELRGNGP